MARTILAQLILQLKDELSGKAKGAANSLRDVEKAAAALNKSGGKGLDVLGNQLDRATKEAQAFAKAMGAPMKWGASFQNQVDRLKLSVGEMEKLKRSWKALSTEIAGAGDQAFQTAAIRRWKNEALGSVVAARAAQEELAREATAAEKKRIAEVRKAETQAAKERAAEAKRDAAAREKAAREAVAAVRKAADEEVKVQRRAEAEKTRIAAREAAERARIAKQEAREAERAERDAVRAASEARKRDGRDAVRYARAVAREIGYAAGLGAGTFILARAGRAVGTEAAGVVREDERARTSGLTEGQNARLTAEAYRLSTRYPSVSPTEIREQGRQLIPNVGDFDKAIELLPEYIRGRVALQTIAGPDGAGDEMEQFARFIDIIGRSRSVDDTRALIDGYIRARQVDPKSVTGSDVVQFAKYAASAGKGLDTDFLAGPMIALLMQQGGNRTGTDIQAALSNTVVPRGTKESRAAQERFGVRDKNGLVDPELYISNPYEWGKKHVVPRLQAMGALPQDLSQELTDQQRAQIVQITSELFSNRRGANFFTMMMGEIGQIEAVLGRLAGAEGTASVDRTQVNDPFVAFEGFTTQMTSLLAVLASPAMKEVGPILHDWATAIAGFAAQLKEADAGLGLLGMGGAAAGAVGAGYLGYKALKHFTGAAALEGAALALTGSAQALNTAAARLAGGGAVGDLPGSKGAKTGLRAAMIGLATMAVGVTGLDQADPGGNLWGLTAPLDRWLQKNLGWDPSGSLPPLSGKGDRALPGRTGSGDTEARALGPGLSEAARPAISTADEIRAAFEAAQAAAQQGGQAAGAGFASSTAASLAANGAAIVATAQGIMAQIRAIFAGGTAVRVSPVGVSPAAGAAAARGDVAPVARAGGGSVYPGGSYLVGEFGAERFTPSVAGRIDPIGGGGGATFNNTFHIHGGGEEAAHRIVAELKRQFQQEADGLFADYGMDTA